MGADPAVLGGRDHRSWHHSDGLLGGMSSAVPAAMPFITERMSLDEFALVRGGGEGAADAKSARRRNGQGRTAAFAGPALPSVRHSPLAGMEGIPAPSDSVCHSVRRLGKSTSARSHSRRYCCSSQHSALSFLAKFSDALPQSARNRQLICRPQSRGALGELLWRIAIRPGLSGRHWKSCTS